MEAWKQHHFASSSVVWISDGAPWLWRLYTLELELYATGILDFYHAAQHLWKAASTWLDGRTKKAKQWFQTRRHQIRHGQLDSVLKELSQAADSGPLPQATQKTLATVLNYLQTHQKHMDYSRFKELGFPLGSGFVESTCKWLIKFIPPI